MYGEKYQELGRIPVASAKIAARSIQSKKRKANAHRNIVIIIVSINYYLRRIGKQRKHRTEGKSKG